MDTDGIIWEHPAIEVFKELMELVRSKSHDYADNDDPFTNFTGSAYLANVTTEQVFMMLIGVKVERLRQLFSGKEPNHEGIEDTLKDLANYATLLVAYMRREAEREWQVMDGLTEALSAVTLTVIGEGDHAAILGED